MEKIFSADLLKKYSRQILVIIGVFVGLALTAAFMIKPRYKVASVISISPSYFQNSLMREFLSEVYDPSELRSQRMSIMTAALDKKFLDQIALMDGVDISSETSEQAAERRMLALTMIEIIPTQASDFQISVISHDREKALALNQKVIDNIKTILKEKRMQTLSNLRSAVAAQIKTMAPGMEMTDTPEGQSAQIENLKLQISELKEKFSNQHPQVVALERKLAAFKKSSAKMSGADGRPKQFNSKEASAGKTTTNTVYDDLVRKLRYIDIVIAADASPEPSYFSVVRSPEYPLNPIWPKKTLFLIWSLLLGILTSLVYIAVAEIGSKKLNEMQGKKKRTLDFLENDLNQKSEDKANQKDADL